jgi:5'-nucleotidase
MTLSHRPDGDQRRPYNDFMKLLLTNDDGISAPGLTALHQAAAQLGEAMIVAPSACLSGCSHRVTTDRVLEIESLNAHRFAVTGTPADCVRVALHGLVPQLDWVLSGINAGGNLGADVWHSGTVAAAREAALHGLPAIALSHYRRKDSEFDWTRATAWVLPLLRELMCRPRRLGTFWNINLPNPPTGTPDPVVVFCPLDPGPLPLSYRDVEGRLHYNADYHARPRVTGSDVDVCFSGKIAVSLLSIV